MADKVITGYGQSIKFVDLGLPSGTLWASQWLGATDDNPYGDYTYIEYIKYVAENFNPNEDVVYPNCEQINELFNNVKITKYIDNDYEGVKLTSKNNGAFIILPASGYIDDNGDVICKDQLALVYKFYYRHLVKPFSTNDSNNQYLIDAISGQHLPLERNLYKDWFVFERFRFPILLSTREQGLERVYLLKAKYLDRERNNKITYEIDTSESDTVTLIVYFYDYSDAAGLIQFNYSIFSAEYQQYSEYIRDSENRRYVYKYEIKKEVFYNSRYFILATNENFDHRGTKIDGKTYHYYQDNDYGSVYIPEKYQYCTPYGYVNGTGHWTGSPCYKTDFTVKPSSELYNYHTYLKEDESEKYVSNDYVWGDVQHWNNTYANYKRFNKFLTFGSITKVDNEDNGDIGFQLVFYSMGNGFFVFEGTPDLPYSYKDSIKKVFSFWNIFSIHPQLNHLSVFFWVQNQSFSNNYFNVFSIGRSDILTSAGGNTNPSVDYANGAVFSFDNKQINVFDAAKETPITISSTFSTPYYSKFYFNFRYACFPSFYFDLYLREI